VVSRFARFIGPGFHTPARALLAAALAVLAVPAQAHAQPAQPAPSPAPPDSLTAAKLVWSSMAALHHANDTGNYSVLRDLAAPSFQGNNSAATLAGIFQEVRQQRIDLSNTLIVAPVYEIPPTIVEGGLLRIRGNFPLRPVAIAFDLLFQNVQGQWRIFGIAVAPIVTQQPQVPQQNPPRPAPTRR
jgi:hypothetical protein